MAKKLAKKKARKLAKKAAPKKVPTSKAKKAVKSVRLAKKAAPAVRAAKKAVLAVRAAKKAAPAVKRARFVGNGAPVATAPACTCTGPVLAANPNALEVVGRITVRMPPPPPLRPASAPAAVRVVARPVAFRPQPALR